MSFDPKEELEIFQKPEENTDFREYVLKLENIKKTIDRELVERESHPDPKFRGGKWIERFNNNASIIPALIYSIEDLTLQKEIISLYEKLISFSLSITEKAQSQEVNDATNTEKNEIISILNEIIVKLGGGAINERY